MNTFIFKTKAEIKDFIYKIKLKEDKVNEQLDIVNDVIRLCELAGKDIEDKKLIFGIKSKYFLKKLELINND